MKAFLTLGKDKSGSLLDIKTQTSGQTSLTCPFCDVPLIAIKGHINTHHFRHDGETCHESLNELPKIAGWDHFHLSFPKLVVDTLKEEYRSNIESKSPNRFNPNRLNTQTERQQFMNNGLIKQNEWSGGFELTDKSLIIVGGLSLPKFSQWMRLTLKDRYLHIKKLVQENHKHPAFSEIEAQRQQNILTSTLYLFSFTRPNGSAFYKVGRTGRDPKTRLAEVKAIAEKLLDTRLKATVIRCVESAGYIEQFALYKYAQFQMKLGVHKEFLDLDAATIKRIKSEFTRLNKMRFPFDKEELFITTGRWKYEKKRLEKSKIGINRTLRSKGRFGRPLGSIMSVSDYLDRHRGVVNLLINEELSISDTSKRTGVSESTVKRVKKALKANHTPKND